MSELTTLRATETPRATGRRELGNAPDLPDGYEQQPADPPSALTGGVELTRLISLAGLTPPQALEIGAGVLAEAVRRSEPDTGGSGSDQVVIGQVVIGADGRVVLGPTADVRHNGKPSAIRPTGSAVEAVLANVAGAARLRARRADPVAEQLLAELDRAVTELRVAGIPAVARMLQEAATLINRRAVRAELAALVRAIGGRAGSGSGAEPAAGPSTAVRAALAGRATNRESSTARRIGAWLLSVLVLASVVLLEVAILRDHIATDIRLLLDAGRSGSAPSTAPEPEGLPFVSPAPAAAGNVTAVDLRPLAPCAPGAPCTLRLLVRLVSGADPQVVTWSYRIVDRCTGATDTAPGGSLTVPAAGERAAAVGTVPLPALQAVAVVAVTDLPAAAASSPVFVGSCLPDQQAR